MLLQKFNKELVVLECDLMEMSPYYLRILDLNLYLYSKAKLPQNHELYQKESDTNSWQDKHKKITNIFFHLLSVSFLKYFQIFQINKIISINPITPKETIISRKIL